jgi:hypothetical protein
VTGRWRVAVAWKRFWSVRLESPLVSVSECLTAVGIALFRQLSDLLAALLVRDETDERVWTAALNTFLVFAARNTQRYAHRMTRRPAWCNEVV